MPHLSDERVVTYDVSDGVATVALARPEKGNAWRWDMCEQLEEVFDAADRDDAARVVLVVGEGKHFSVGMDLDAVDTLAAPGRPTIDGHIRDSAGRVTLKMMSLRKPIVVAMHGAAIGVGTTLTLAGDIRIAGESARFGLPFTRLGIVPEGTSTWLLPRIVGLAQALEWIITGRTFDAAEALRGGLVSRVVPDAELRDTALGLAREIAATTSPTALAHTRQLVWRMLGATSPWEAHRLESAFLEAAAKGPDCREAAAAFKEKRAPVFNPEVAEWPGAPRTRWPEVPPGITVVPTSHDRS